MNVERTHFVAVERPGPTAAKHRELVARFIDGTVPVNPFRNTERGTARVRSGNKFGRGPRAEAREMRGVIPGRQNLQNPKAVLAVSNKGKRSCGHHSDFQDRKSTRLNSSHSQISYAVFCLKKKKKQR